jgi:ATP-binding cassette, subfamily B, multidrug efflux pump
MKKLKLSYSENPSSLPSYWRKEWKVIIIIAISGILYNFGMLLNPYFEGVLIDFLLSGNTSLRAAVSLVGIFIGCIFLVQIVRSIKRYFVRVFANNVVSTMRMNLYNNLLHESFVELEKENMGVLLNRLQSDCHQTVEGMRKLTTEIFDTVILFLFYIVYLLCFSIQMTLIGLIPVALAIFISFLMRKEIYLSNSKSKEAQANLSSMTFSMMDHAWMYRLYSRDEANEKKYDELLQDYEGKTIRSEVLTNIALPMCNIISLIGLIPIIFMGAGYVIDGTALSFPIPSVMKENWTIGTFSTYITTFVLLSSKASHTAKLFSSVEKGLSSWKRIKPYIQPYREFDHGTKIEGERLVFSNFGMEVDGKNLFHGLNLEVKKGQVIALTGPIASGKSAFGKVFLKSLDYQGSVNLFGKELKEYTFPEIKGNVSYMGHRNELMTDSIKTNIAFGEEKDVLPYLSMVSFDKDMTSMPEKEETIIGNEGVKLSGGQQERVALARTFYHKKGLIILDDPFASVDIHTEHEIMMKLKEEAKDSILLFFSHRLSYFPYCDKVMVINKDKSISVGNHESLLKENSTYQELYNLQRMEVEHD